MSESRPVGLDRAVQVSDVEEGSVSLYATRSLSSASAIVGLDSRSSMHSEGYASYRHATDLREQEPSYAWMFWIL